MKNIIKYIFLFLRRFIFFYLISIFFLANSQEISKELSLHINEKLISIDSLLESKEYNLALTKVKDLESYSNYISNKGNRLDLELKKAKALFGNAKQEEAMDLLLKGLNELNLIDYPKLKNKYLDFIAKTFWRSKNYNRSFYYYNLLFKNASIMNDTANILNAYLYKGLIASRLNKGDSSIYFYKKMVEYPTTEKTWSLIAKGYNNLSSESVNILADLELAKDYGDKSIQIREKYRDTLGIAFTLINLSAIYYKNEEFEIAKSNYLRAFETVKNLKSQRALQLKENSLYNLAYVNEELNNFKDAYKYLEKATDLTDSLAQANVAQNISEIEAKYNVEKQAAEIEREKSKRLRAQAMFYGTALAFLGLLALAYIFYRNYRLKQQNKLDQIENESQTKIINATIDAKEKERKAIAETLHDSVSALLSSANLHLQATKAQLKKTSAT